MLPLPDGVLTGELDDRRKQKSSTSYFRIDPPQSKHPLQVTVQLAACEPCLANITYYRTQFESVNSGFYIVELIILQDICF
ncbi:hypothetical protein [Prosthecochloris sp.]|uniref:hypothetical protein n=1 Tax=Prosthecochloris sp. TaxID=290513 RepID=UPI0025801661|nr:hypothetical protein [Prosthecochloris sp.]